MVSLGHMLDVELRTWDADGLFNGTCTYTSIELHSSAREMEWFTRTI